MLRVLEDLLSALAALKQAIGTQDRKGLEDLLGRAQSGRSQWWAERSRGDWRSVEGGKQDFPTVGDVLRQQVGGLGKLFRRGGKPESDG